MLAGVQEPKEEEASQKDAGDDLGRGSSQKVQSVPRSCFSGSFRFLLRPTAIAVSRLAVDSPSNRTEPDAQVRAAQHNCHESPFAGCCRGLASRRGRWLRAGAAEPTGPCPDAGPQPEGREPPSDPTRGHGPAGPERAAAEARHQDVRLRRRKLGLVLASSRLSARPEVHLSLTLVVWCRVGLHLRQYFGRVPLQHRCICCGLLFDYIMQYLHGMSRLPVLGAVVDPQHGSHAVLVRLTHPP